MSSKRVIAECLNYTPGNNINEEDAIAIKALYEGKADSYMQQVALDCIVNKICRTNDLLYIPGDNALDTAFLNGRAFVGQKIKKLAKVPIKFLKLKEPEEVDDNG